MVLAFGLLASDVWAQTRAYSSATVTPGKPARLGYYATFKADCTPGPLPEIRVLEAPKHGTLIVRRAKLKAGDQTKCPGKEAPVQVVFYQAALGYSGQDSLSYEVKHSSGEVSSFTLSITVTARGGPANSIPGKKSI